MTPRPARFGLRRSSRVGALVFWSCVAAAALHDGTFDDDTAGWVDESYGGLANPGTVVSDAGVARLTEGDGFLVVLEQSFTTVATDTTLSFTVSPTLGFAVDDAGFDDAFEVHLVDDSGVSVVPTWREGATAFLSAQPDPAHSEPALLHLADGVTITETGDVTVDLTGVPVGTHATLIFGLVGANASTTSSFTVDDVLLPHAGNTAPTSVPGADVTADCAEPVSLDGSASYDPNGDSLAYFWRDELDDALVASTVDVDLDDLVPGIHTYALTVDDGYGGTSSASLDVTITDETAPVLDAPDRRSEPAALPGCTVAIPDLTHYPVDDCDDVTVTQSPAPGGSLAAGSSVTVTLTATDGSSNTATHPIEVVAVGLTGCADTTTPTNGPPVADAGTDIAGTCRGSVVLNGTHSSDPDFDQLTYTWRDAAGAVVGTTALVDLGTLAYGTTTYELTVDDGFGEMDADTVVVTSADDDPAFVSVRTLWEVEADASCAGLVPDIANSASIVTRDCSAVTVTQSPVAGTALSFDGPTTVTLTATDASSNTTTTTVTARLVDTDASCLPVADAGDDVAIACDATATLDASGSSSPEALSLTYAWTDEDDVELGTTAILELGTLSTGSHRYALTVSDSRGTTSTDTVSLTVTDTTPPVLDVASTWTEEATTCHPTVPDLVTLATATDCGVPVVTQSPAADAALALDLPTTVTVTATDALGHATSKDVVVTATDLDDTCDPVADAGDDQTLQCGQPVILDGTGSLDPKGDGLLYAWSIAGEPVATGGLTTIPTRAGGSYTVALSVLDSGGLTSTDEVVYDVVDDTAPVFYDPPDLATIPLDGTCAAVVPDLAAELLALDCSTVTYTQDVSAGTSLTVGTPVTVTVTATDAFAQSATWQVDVIAVGAAACDTATDTDPGDGDTDTLVQPTVAASVPEVHEADNPVVCGAFSAGDVAFALGTTTLSRTYSITIPAATAEIVGEGSGSIAGGDFGLWTQDFDLYSEATPWADHTLRVHSRELRIGLTSYNGHVWDQELPWANTFEAFEVARHPGCPDSDDPACALALDTDDPSWAPGVDHHEGTFVAQLPENALLLHFCSAYLAEGPGVDITLQYAFEWTSTSECTSTSGYAAIAVHDVLADPVSAPVVTLGVGCDCTYLLAHKDEPGGLDGCFPSDTGDSDGVDTDVVDTDASDTDVLVDSDTGTHQSDTDVVDDTDVHETDTDVVADTDIAQDTDIPDTDMPPMDTDVGDTDFGDTDGGGDPNHGLMNCHGNNGNGNNDDGHDGSNPGNGGGGPNGDTDPSGDVDDEMAHGHRTHPSAFDEDGDCMPLKTENAQGTSATDPDVDDDGIPDGHEVQNGTNPHNSDSDNDGLKDAQEEHWKTDPNNPDSDGDGQSDGYEVDHGTDPLLAGA